MGHTSGDQEAIGELMQGESPAEMISASELGRALAAQRRRDTFSCEVCGVAFEAWARKSQPARTCSPKCRIKLHRQQQRSQEV
jgi:hypothetical protein